MAQKYDSKLGLLKYDLKSTNIEKENSWDRYKIYAFLAGLT